MTDTNNTPEGYIDVTDVSLPDLIQAAYALSAPLGLGMLHYRPGALTNGEVIGIINSGSRTHDGSIHMDYINGRAVKMTIRMIDGRRYISKH